VKKVLRGDIDNNGIVDPFDLRYLRRTMNGWDGYVIENIYSADLDGNGLIDPFDLRYLRRAMNEWDGYTID
jgi:hypothetical protein